MIDIELPSEYALMDQTEIKNKILKIKEEYGNKLVILGHHYQNDLIVKLSDLKGDSFGLSKAASEQKEAEKIVFCGVHFMAEAARILAKEHQTVYLPNSDAGCPMADMADIHDVETSWKELSKFVDTNKVIPICYMNSTAAIKAFCGKYNGIVCTSGNAQGIFKWAFERGEKLFFLPDEHLGTNTAQKMGIDRIEIWDPEFPNGGLSPDSINKAKVIVWKGYCHVHAYKFNPEDIEKVRKEYPGVKVIVHPECTKEAVMASDDDGSTAYIIDYVEKAPKGSIIAVGTELNLVKRLHDQYEGIKTVVPVKRSICPNMMKIQPGHLLFCLENLNNDAFVVTVDEEITKNAKLALERMLTVK